MSEQWLIPYIFPRLIPRVKLISKNGLALFRGWCGSAQCWFLLNKRQSYSAMEYWNVTHICIPWPIYYFYNLQEHWGILDIRKLARIIRKCWMVLTKSSQGERAFLNKHRPESRISGEFQIRSHSHGNCYRLGMVNSNTVNSKLHLIQSYCEIFFYHFPNISCLKCTVNSNWHLIQSKTVPTNDFELTVPEL